MKDPSSRLLKFRLALEEYDYIVEYVRGSENSAADALSRIRIISKDLKDMSECSLNVLTRAQKKRMEEEHSMSGMNNDSLCDSVNTDDWLDHPRVVEIHNKPKISIELRLINKSNLQKLRKDNEIACESRTFIYIRFKENDNLYKSSYSITIIARRICEGAV